MKTWKKILILSLTIIALAIIGFVIALVVAICRPKSTDTTWIGESTYVQSRLYGFPDVHYTFSVFNYKINRFTLRRLKAVDHCDKGGELMWFRDRNDKYGLFSRTTGEVVIKAQYDRAWTFSKNGLGVVSQGGKMGVINEQNEWVISPTFDAPLDKVRCRDFAFHGAYCNMMDSTDKVGLIDQKGQWILPPTYDGIYGTVCDTLWIAKLGDKRALLSANGHVLLPPIYSEMYIKDDGLLVTKDGIRQLITLEGKVLRPFLYEKISPLYYAYGDYDDETITHPKKLYEYRLNYKQVGVVDEHGQVILPAIYYSVDQVSDYLLQAQLEEHSDYMLFDMKGNMVIQ